ncbi:substrate-binding domain-containing protein [Nonomuraea ferruginea]
MAGVTAVFVANDQMALGVLRAFTEKGVRVPGQVSVVGFDDIPESAFFSPPLTTIRQDFGAVGRHSIGVLLRQIEARRAAGKRAARRPTHVRPPRQHGRALSPATCRTALARPRC